MTFSFPLYKVEEIISRLYSLPQETFGPEFDLQTEDFLKPTKARWMHLYTCLLAAIVHTNVESLRLSLWPAIDSSVDQPVMYEESMHVFNLASCMRGVLEQICVVTDFSAQDINCANTNSKRLTRIMSGITNFLQFADQRREEYACIRHQMSAKEAKKAELKARIDDQQRKINDMKAKRALEDESIKQVNGEVDACVNEATHLQESSNELLRKSQIVKLSIDEKQASHDKMKQRLEIVDNRLTVLDNQIIKSPTRCRIDIDQSKNKYTEKMASKDSKQRKLNALQPKLKLAKQCAAEAEQAEKLAAGILDSDEKAQKLEADIKQAKNEYQGLKNISDELELQLQDIRSTEQNKQEKLDKIILQFSLKEDHARSQLQQLIGEITKKTNAGGQLSQLTYNRSMLRKEYENLDEECEKEIDALSKQCLALYTARKKYDEVMTQRYKQMLLDDLKIDTEESQP